MPVFLPASTSAATTDDLIEATRRHLLSGAGEGLNLLDGALDATQATVTFAETPLTGVGPGTIISVGLESMRAWEVLDASAGTVRVLRGYQGSTATTHADGDLARLNPPHTDFAIFHALNAAISALSGEGLFRMMALDLTTSSDGERTYDLVADLLDVYDVSYDADTTANQWPRVVSFALRRDLPVVDFPSGNALRIDSTLPTDRPMRVTYKAPLGAIVDLSDNAETATGLLPSALDLPPIDAAWRLSSPAEVQRNQTQRQGDSRRAEEVPPGAKLRAPLGLADMRARRIRAEIANLHRRWPERRR